MLPGMTVARRNALVEATLVADVFQALPHEPAPDDIPVTATRRPSPAAIGAWLAVALGIVWLVALGGGFYGIYGSALRVVSVVLAAIALGAWGVAALREPSWRPRSAIWPALAVPLAAFAVTTLTSERPRISAEYLAYTIVLAALYLLLRALLAHAAFRDRITGLSVILALGIGIAYVVACVGRWIDWWDAVGALRVPPLRPLLREPDLRQPERGHDHVGPPHGRGGRAPGTGYARASRGSCRARRAGGASSPCCPGRGPGGSPSE